MLLFPPQQIREQLGFDDMPDINTAVTMAVEAIEPQIAGLLATEFEKQTGHMDVFFAVEPRVDQGRHRYTEFRLSRGFVFNVGVTAKDPTNGTRTLGQTLLIDEARGVVRDIGTPFRNSYVEISFDSGFDADGTDPTLYDQAQVPDWLKQAARIGALRSLASNPTVTNAGIELDKGVLDAHYAALVNRHIRYAPDAILAL